VDFAITEEERLILESVDRFMARHLPPDEVRRRDRAHEPPDFLVPLMAEQGMLGLAFPEHFGGGGRDWTTVALVQERLGYHAGMAASLFSTTVCFGGMSLMTYGSPAQREDLLPKLIRGQLRFALALTEPGAGSDAAALTTRAAAVDGGWRVNGRKTWISSANVADYLVTACRTAAGSKGADGVSMLMIPHTSPGIAMTRLEKVGNNCLTSWDIGFDDVFVPRSALLGEEGKGFRHLMQTLHFSRAGQAANATGQAQKAVDLAVNHARERVQFGQAIGRFQTIQHRLADMQTRVDMTRLLLYRLAWLITTGERCRKEAAQAKLVASETLQFVADHGMQILASAGYSLESDMQRIWRDSRLYTFGEGASEIQRTLIAREMGL
jgi:alkylation response protein AidB-like acyl-CoA dehydrogenase